MCVWRWNSNEPYQMVKQINSMIWIRSYIAPHCICYENRNGFHMQCSALTLILLLAWLVPTKNCFHLVFTVILCSYDWFENQKALSQIENNFLRICLLKGIRITFRSIKFDLFILEVERALLCITSKEMKRIILPS